MRKLVRSQTAQRLKKLDSELRRAVAKPKDAGTIHDLRVSIRRLTEALKVFEEWFKPGPLKKIRASLKKLMDRCAAVRNCDIAGEVLRAAGWQDPEIFAGLEEERRRTRGELARELAGWLKKDRVRKWSGHLHVGHTDSRQSAEETARGLLPAMTEELFRMGRAAARPDSSRPQMHQFRLKTKHMRYTLELFEGVYERKTASVMALLKELQEKLGSINDCATTLEMVRRNRGAAAALRRLAGEREAEFRAYWRQHFGPREEARWKAVLGAADRKA